MHTLHPSVAKGAGIASPVAISFSSPRPLARASSRLSCLVPDMALAASFATLLYLFVLFGGTSALFRDSDAGWHIRNGEQILSSGLLPRVDPYSFSKAGQPWISWEWLSDVASGAVHQTWGLPGVAWMYGLGIAATVWLWFRLNWACGGNFLLACLFAAPMLSTANLHWLARPHIFGWALLLGAVWFCERLPQRLSPGILLVIALYTSLWANVHGSFFLAPAIALIYAAGHAARPFLWDGTGLNSAVAYLTVAAAAALGSFLNPYGWHLHSHVAYYNSNGELLDRIGEFQTFNFHAEGAGQILLGLGIACAGGFAAISARRPERFLLSLLFCAMAVRTARMLPVAALILLPLANGSLTAAFRAARFRLKRQLDAVLDYGDALRVLDSRFNGIALMPLAAVFLFFVLRTPIAQAHTGFPKDQFPVQAASAVSNLPADARLFAPDKFGGYLIYRFNGSRKVFFDGRSDFYGPQFLKDYGRMVQVRPGWQAEWAKWHFSHALLPVDYSLVPALQTDGWKEIYRDKTSTLLAAPAVVMESRESYPRSYQRN